MTLRSGERRDEHGSNRLPGDIHALLFDRYADAVFVADIEGRYVDANLAACLLLGYSRQELLGLRIPDVTATEQGEAEFSRFAADGYWRGEIDLRRKDGSTVRVEARASLVETPDGTWGVSIVRESSDPLRAALQASQAQLAAVVEASEDAIFSGSSDGVIRTWNAGAERIYGYPAEEIVGQHVSVLAPPERRGELERNLRTVQRGGSIREYETTRLRKDGSRVQVSLTVSPIRDDDGTITGVSAIARDVTRRRLAEHRAHILYQLTSAVGHARDEDEVFDAALDALGRGVHTDRASILLFDDEGVMRFRAWRGLSSSYRRAVDGHSPWARDSVDPSPIHVPDVDAAEDLGELRATILGEGIHALSFIPLTHQGELLGKFMLYFDTPRGLSDDEQRLALTIGEHVAFALARMRAEHALEAARAQLELITLASADGLTIQDATGRVVYANLAAARLSGFDSVDEFLADAARYADRWNVFDEDGTPVDPARLPGRRALAGEPNPELLLHVVDRRTGTDHWRHVRATPSRDATGKVRYAINLFHDVTAERRAHEQLRFQAALLRAQAEASIEGVLVIDTAGRIASWNRRFAEMWDVPEEILEAGADRGALTPVLSKVVDPEAFGRRVEELIADPTAEEVDQVELLDGRLFERHTKPLVDEAGESRGRIWFFRDATDERRRDASQRLLVHAGKALASSLEDEARFDAVLDAVLAWKADAAALYVNEGDAVRMVALRMTREDLRPQGRELLTRFALQDRPEHPVLRSLDGERAVVIETVPEELVEAATGGGPLLDIARSFRIGSVAIAPIRSRGESLGAVAVMLEAGGRRYDERDGTTLERLASRIALAFDNSRLYRERDFIARTLQASLLPAAMPEVPGLEVAARYRAAGEGIEVGGDFYDVFRLSEETCAVAVGDVCGKGPTAAALTGVARHTMRAAALLEKGPADTLALVNEAILRESPEERFCTLAFVRLERTDDGFGAQVCLGGHPPPILLRADGSVEEVRDPGSLLGLFPDPHLPETRTHLRRGDSMVLYTDGVTDEQRDGQEFGVERLRDLVASAAGLPPAEVAARIEDAVAGFSPGPPRDDIAIVVVRATA